ncbi:MAG: rhomboid family intramembrane serine protease [Bacteroidetes bacterium]|nr:MAG: rhomboid family intramembrane serine protease [Bacteroidota bacterium]
MDLRQSIRLFTAQYKTTGWLLLLMGSGLLLQGILWVAFTLAGKQGMFMTLMQWLTLPPRIQDLIFRPWVLVTYPFFPNTSNVIGLLMDALILWSFGRIHQQLLGDQRSWRLSLLSVPLVGLLTVLIATPMGFPDTWPAYTSGMSALIITLVISSVTLVPDYPVQLLLLGQVRIIWIGLVLLLLELLNYGFTPMGISVSLGALVGFLHIYLLKSGTDITELIWAWIERDEKEERQPRMKVKRGEAGSPSATRAPRQGSGERPSVTQDIVDTILDKISAKGYESLSREEKEILYKASKQKEDEKPD